MLPSKVANWLIGKVTGVPIKDNGCSLKAYRADLIKNIPLYNEMHRFIPAMASLAAPAHRADQGAPSCAPVRQVEVRLLAHLQGVRRSGDDPQHPVVQPPAGDLARASIAGLGGLGALLCAGYDAVAARHRSAARSRSYSRASSVLLGSLAIFSVFLALLSHLIYGTTRHPLPPVPDDVGPCVRGRGRPSPEYGP